ncbi:hypothetical protein, partial [uncultured Acinetobacter sp.]|uniref:hypothetical protein n=1 Tax=uncultured Acinetobacter sp. TaxID=165433 RepID=UPI00261AECEF
MLNLIYFSVNRSVIFATTKKYSPVEQNGIFKSWESSTLKLPTGQQIERFAQDSALQTEIYFELCFKRVDRWIIHQIR